MTYEQKVALIRGLGDAVTDAVKAAGPAGAPGGTIYACLMGLGITLESYQTIMDTLVQVGRLTKRGELYYVATR